MYAELLTIAVGVVVTEALTELFIHSEIMAPVRGLIESVSDHVSKLFSCGYCLSVWIAWIVSMALMESLPTTSSNPVLNLSIWTIVLHRLSNYLNDFIDRYLREDYTEAEVEDEDIFIEADKHFGITGEVHDTTDISLPDLQE